MADTPEHDGTLGPASPGHDGQHGPSEGIHPADLPSGPDATPPKLVEVSINAPQFQVAAAHPERVERGIAVMFVLGLAGFAGFGAAYWQNWSNLWLGVSLAVGMFGLGIGMVAWGKYLMPRGPFSESRHAAGPTEEERQEFLTDFSSRGKIAIERRSFLLKILGAAGGVFGIVALFPLLRSLGPLPKHLFYETSWRRGSYLTTPDGRKVQKDDLDQGGVLTVFPEDDIGGALSQVLLIRPLTTDITTAPGRSTWGPNGYLAFSKVCTHAGCPVALFQKAIDELLCPCHQSIFEVGPNKPATPIFGPAPRPLPQLPIYIDRKGYLRAQGGFDQPVGPGFWERGDKGIAEVIDGLFNWVDDRLNISGSSRKLLNKIFPDHWSFMLGEIALYSFVILLATGVFLTLYFVPSQKDVVYQGAYLPLNGQHVSEAYASTINLSFSVRCGLLMRQMHHWAANIFVGSIVVHMCRIFFTGGFRRPREFNWIIGVNLLILAIFNGFLGYSLPDDLVSGTGIRIAFSILESLPIVGSYLATFLFGGNYPGTAIIPRFFIIHVLILPAIIAGLIAAHLGLLVKQKHTQFAGGGATEKNVVGAPMWPTFIAKTNGFLFLVAGVTALLAATVQINPIWQYGPYVPYKVSYAVQPDWYMGWLDGALRVMPSWEIVFPGHMIPNAFFPGILLPGITFTVLMMWPMIEAKVRKDTLEHQILDEPRNNPWRTALGASVLSFYFVLFGASATDVLANYLSVSLNTVLVTFRVLCFVVPAIVYPVTYKICLELQHQHRPTKTKRHNIVMRSEDGGYSTIEVEARPGDERTVLPPIPLDAMVLVGEDGSANGVAADGGPVTNGSNGSHGVFQVPRTYR